MGGGKTRCNYNSDTTIVEDKWSGSTVGAVLWGPGQGGKSRDSSRGSRNVCSKGLSGAVGSRSRDRIRSS